MTVGSPKAIYLELDGLFYRISSGRIQSIEDLAQIDEEAWVVTDFGDAFSQVLTLAVHKKYAPLVARKEVQEAGQLYGPVHIIPHWVGKRGKDSSVIFFTAVRLELYHHYVERFKEHQAPVLLFPLGTILFATLRARAGREPMALVFQHGRVADLLVGTREKVFYATRLMAFDETEEQLSSLWQTILNELESVEQDQRIEIQRLLSLTWITGFRPKDLRPDGPEIYWLPEGEFIFEDKKVKASLPVAIRKTSGMMAVSGPTEKLNYFSKKFLPLIGIAMTAMATAMFLGHIYLSSKNSEIKSRLDENKRKLSAQTGAMAEIEMVQYQDVLDFVDLLQRCSQSPSFKDLVNLVSSLLPHEVEVKKLDAKYHEWGLEVEVEVKTTLPFDEAHRVYQKFLKGMARVGYVAELSTFNTSIQESEFMARLKKVI